VLGFYPLPNVRPINEFTQERNYLSLAITPTDQDVTNFRIDHRISGRDTIFGRYSGTRNTKRIKGFGLGVAEPATNAGEISLDQHNVLLNETHVFSANIVNEFKSAINRTFLPFVHPSFEQDWPDRLGMPAIIPRTLFPTVSAAGVMTIGPSAFPAGVRASHYVQISDSVAIFKGRHQIKIGTDHRWWRLNWTLHQYPSGLYQFSDALTGDPQRPAGTGVGMATFLLGDVTGGRLQINPAFSFNSWSNGSFIQDDIKVTPRLTLNLGLRYDYASPPTERYDRYSNFDPYLVNPETGLPGVLTYAAVTSPRSFVDPDRNNFGPRAGFAYDLTGDGKTALRAAYGVVYIFPTSSDARADSSNALGFLGRTDFVPERLGPYRAFRFSEGPAQLLQPLGASGGPSAFRGQSVQYQDRNAPNAYLQQWNLTLQRALPGSWVVSASYAGNRGVKLPGANYDLNQLDPAHFALGLGLQQQVSNPFFGQITQGALSSSTVQRSQLLTPYPDYLAVSTFQAHAASSVYHSLQVTVEKRYSNGLSALFSYTTSKLINDSVSVVGGGSAGGDFRAGRFNRRLERAIDQDDVSQRAVLSAVYELPFGRGKPWLGSARGVTGHLVGGWQINTITTIQTGFPLVVRGANNFTGINWPDVTRDPTLSGSERSVLRWFDSEAFRNPADFTIGNVPRTLPNTRGPGLFDMSFSVFKNFRLAERTKLEFRAEIFNAVNHVNYANPNTSFSPNRQGVNTNPNFGRILSALDARTIQLGLRLAF
jgi:hypothetical protein